MTGTLVLGDVTFQDMEIPDEMPFGGAQAYKLHKLVGGGRVADAMGRDDGPKTWSGRFLGPDAVTRARSLDAMRIAGQPVSLTWDEFAFTVLVVKYDASFSQPFNLTYSITVEVITDDAQPVAGGSSPTVDDMMDQDTSTASGLADEIGDDELTSDVGSIQTATSGVTSFLTATQDQINSVLQPISSAAGRVSSLIGQAEGTLNSLPGFAGVVSGAPPLQSAQNLLSAVSNMGQVSTLYNLQSVLTRMTKNLGSVQKAGTQIITDGLTDLYGYASRHYGDPSEWATIAAANGLTDPEVPAGTTILIPTSPSGDGGVLQP